MDVPCLADHNGWQVVCRQKVGSAASNSGFGSSKCDCAAGKPFWVRWRNVQKTSYCRLIIQPSWSPIIVKLQSSVNLGQLQFT